MVNKKHSEIRVLERLANKLGQTKTLHIWKFSLPLQQQLETMEHKPKFKIIYSKEAISFLESLPEKAQSKIAYNIERCMHYIDKELFKKLENTEIREFRTLYNGIAYRLFAFWDTDKDTLVIATHGIIKKTQKNPAKEISKAEAMRKEYFELKNK